MTNHYTRLIADIKKISCIARLLILEQLRQSTAILWSALAPCLLFFLTQDRQSQHSINDELYISNAAWFLSYISASVALFGFSSYLIGRRESGFVRSFIYQPSCIRRFLMSHTLSYSAVSLLYAVLFYAVTKPLFGNYRIDEILFIIACFYTSFMMFSCIGLSIAALPIKFTTAHTLFSLLSFLMLLSGYLGTAQPSVIIADASALNPLRFSTSIFNGHVSLTTSFCVTFAALLAGLYLTGRYFRVQPIWSRY